MTRVLLLGGAGFLGRPLARSLAAHGHDVTIFNRPASLARHADALAGLRTIAGDLADTDALLRALADADVLVHLAHSSVIRTSMADPALDLETNVVPNLRWLPRIAEGGSGPRRIIYVSSGGAVYGTPRRLPIDEEHPTEPISAYGVSKLAMEKYVTMYARLANVIPIILRVANVYGPGHRTGVPQGLVGTFAHRAVRGEPLQVWGDGSERRDYLYIDDFVSAVSAVMDYGGEQRVFNVGTGSGHSINDLIARLGALLKAPPAVERQPRTAFDVPANILDAGRLRAETGWRPRVAFDDGVAMTLAAAMKDLQPA